MSLPRLLLVGGGHAHVQVLESIAGGGWPPADVLLLSPATHELYTGMVPGFLQAQYELSDLSVDLSGLCDRARVRLVLGRAVGVDVSGRRVITEGEPISFDLLSLDIGSVPAGLDVPGVREHAVTVRPLRRMEELRRRIEGMANAAGAERIGADLGSGAAGSDAGAARYSARGVVAAGRGVRVVVVGGGAGGVEVALAVHRRLWESGAHPGVTLIERGTGPVESYPRAAQQKVAGLLTRKGIGIRTDSEVVQVDSEGVELDSGSRVDAELVVWVTGAVPPPLTERAGLPLSARGYFEVDGTLRSVGGEPIWAAGDCADIRDNELPRAGVYAVREGPVLAANLRAAIGGGEPRTYRPQRAILSLLNTADDRALLRWRGVVAHNRAAWWLKDWIDRRWVGRFGA